MFSCGCQVFFHPLPGQAGCFAENTQKNGFAIDKCRKRAYNRPYKEPATQGKRQFKKHLQIELPVSDSPAAGGRNAEKQF